eukprot:NODE_359_length_8799_cov_0.795172.p6 type:complete len:195 gc:universal NODE_359_length_8799_cov_0.795172:3694-3110(-)
MSHFEKPNGLSIFENVITEHEERLFMNYIDEQNWYGNGIPLCNINSQLRRRFQMYGKLFCFSTRKIISNLDIPPSINLIAQKIKSNNPTFKRMNSIMVNEYKIGQGIMPHVDANVFGDTVVILSMGCDVKMIFINEDQKIVVPIRQRSLLILQAEARFLWKHSIPRLSKHDEDGEVFTRDPRRLSVMLRECPKF